VIVTGCAHPGVVNIIRKAKKLLKDNVYLIVGGFHLCWMNLLQINGIVKGVEKEKVKKVAPCHCSGDLARESFKKVYKENFILAGAGKRIVISDALENHSHKNCIRYEMEK
jgi:7,8-dihydropterin-6-yl-methyl-4-(beta-D-ribofuranosyl)aminobenzene 5'-phosphate synthase